MKLQKATSRNNIDDLVEDFNTFKPHFEESIEKSNKRHDKNIKNLLNEMRTIKDEIKSIFKLELSREKENIIGIQNSMKSFRDEINQKINDIETAQSSHMEQMKFIIMNTGDESLKLMASKYFDINETDINKLKHIYIKPSHDELKSVVEDLNIKREIQNKKLRRIDTSIEDLNTQNFIKKNIDLKLKRFLSFAFIIIRYFTKLHKKAYLF